MDLAQKPVYKLDLAAGTSVVNLTTPLVEGDDRAQTFTLELTDKGAPANLDGYSVTAYFGRGKTAEAEADTIPLSGTVSGNVATITLTESCYSRSCYFSMPIRLSNGATGQKRTYLIVRGTVVKSVDGTIIDPDGSVPSLDDLFAQIAVMERSRQAAEEAAEEAMAAAARADEAREAIQGDLAALTEEIDNQADANSFVFGGKNLFDPSTVTQNAALQTDGTISALSQYVLSDFIPVAPHVVYYIRYSLVSTSAGLGWYSDKADGALLSVQPLITSGYFVATAPDGAAYMRVTTLASAKETQFVGRIGIPARNVEGLSSLFGEKPYVNLYTGANNSSNRAVTKTGVTTASNITVTDYIPVIPGAKVAINQRIGSSAYGHALYDKNYQMVSFVASSAGALNHVLHVPDGAVWIRCSALTAQLSNFKVFTIPAEKDALHIYGVTMDGATDDTSALADAMRDGNDIVIPAGKTVVVNGLSVPSGRKLNNHGTIKVLEGASTGIVVSGVENVELVVGTIIADGLTANQNAIVVSNCVDCYLHDGEISGALNKGIGIVDSVDCTIENIAISGANSGTGAGLALHGTTCQRNTVRNVRTSGNRIGITINGAHHNVVENCRANADENSLALDGVETGSGDGAHHNVIRGYFANGATSSGYGSIYLGNGAKYNEFTDFVISSGEYYGIKIYDAGECNNFANGIVTAGKNASGHSNDAGAYVGGTPRTIFDNVTFANCGRYGVYIFGGSYTMINGCTVFGSVNGIVITTDYAIVNGGTVHNCSFAGIRVEKNAAVSAPIGIMIEGVAFHDNTGNGGNLSLSNATAELGVTCREW